MSKAEREEYEAALKKRQAEMAKNEALNTAFNNGMQAYQAKDYPTAIAAFKEATAMSDTQDVIWGNLGLAQSGLAGSLTGDEQAAMIAESEQSFLKAMAIDPTKASHPSNLGLALIRGGRVDDGMAHLGTAAALDPANASLPAAPAKNHQPTHNKYRKRGRLRCRRARPQAFAVLEARGPL